MNRQDIIDRMTPQEKEIFEKYENTYPFPIRKFIEEIGGRIEYDDDPINFSKMIEEPDEKFSMIISNHIKRSKKTENMTLLTQLLYYLFTRNDSKYNESTYEMKKIRDEVKVLVCAFLMPRDIFMKQLKKFGPNVDKLAKYFGVTVGATGFYADYLRRNKDVDNIKYH